MIINGPDGKKYWKEMSQLTLPKGGRKITFLPKSFIFMGSVGLVAAYISFQADANPNSWYGVLFKQVVSEPMKSIQSNIDPIAKVAAPTDEKSD